MRRLRNSVGLPTIHSRFLSDLSLACAGMTRGYGVPARMNINEE